MTTSIPHSKWTVSLLVIIPVLFIGISSLKANETPTTSPKTQRTEHTQRRISVADSIRMTRLADPDYLLGASSEGRVGEFSPDGTYFTVVLRKGNLEKNTNEYSLFLFETARVLDSPKPILLLKFASSSNRSAISDVRWLDDNETVTFLGERPGELREVYSLNTRSRRLHKITNSPTDVVSYTTTAKGNSLIFVTAPPIATLLTRKAKRDGVIVSRDHFLGDLVLLEDRSDALQTSRLFLKRGTSSPVAVDEVKDYLFNFSLSPDGRYLVTLTRTQDIPDKWKVYAEPILLGLDGTPVWMPKYTLIDLKTDVHRLLLDAPPSPFGTELAWAPDSKSVVLTNVHDAYDTDEEGKQIRELDTSAVEVSVPSREVLRVAKGDLKLVRWDRRTNMLLFEARDSHAGRRPTAYQKVQSAWQPATVSIAESGTGPQIQVVLDEGINTPPKIFVVDPHSQTRSLLVDLNPQFRDLDFGKVEAITWMATDGHQVQGGLYRPPDYQPGNRYPLVIQTHGFKADRFWMDGPWTTAFAAQALAGKGFVVLQVGSAVDGRDVDFAITAQEAPREMSAYEGAIDHLEQIGLIDRNRVGIIGFSRTCYLVKYALTHSNYNFSAAVVADGTDAGYFQYILLGVNDRQTVMEHNRLNGAPPFGSGLASWIERSPGFQVDKVRTPLRIQALSPFSVMGEWEWFSALSLLRKPVEMVYLPDAEHILEKPWERMVSQQGDVDWFCFWLKGEEDPDPTKAEQYTRWRELRKLQVQNEKKPANAASSTSR